MSMYVPAPFRMTDAGEIARHVAGNAFGFLIVPGAGADAAPEIAPIPMLLEPAAGNDEGPRDVVVGHLARANPLWRRLDGETPATALFPGPHAYISPRWYAEPARAVPTWNYTAAALAGRPVAYPDDAARTRAALRRLVRAYEPADGGWDPDGEAAETVERMLAGVVVFEMPVDSRTGKAKLSQNRAPADIEGAAAALAATGNSADAALAALMRAARPETP